MWKGSMNKTIRKNKRLSQVELAKRCGVPQSTIGRIENYSMNPSIDLLISILKVLNIEIELKDKKSIIKGYDVFGKSYGYMLRNDLHDINSIEHKLMQEQIRLDSVSEPFLYGGYQIIYPLENHELFSFSQSFNLQIIIFQLCYNHLISILKSHLFYQYIIDNNTF